MKWYWWILVVILALNAFMVVAVALFMVFDRFRSNGGPPEDKRRGARRDKRE